MSREEEFRNDRSLSFISLGWGVLPLMVLVGVLTPFL